MRAIRVAAAIILTAGAVLAATTFTGRLIVWPDGWEHVKTGGSSTLEETFSNFLEWTFTSGTGVNQMATIIVETGTLTNGQSVTYDLDAATNGFGDVVDFAAVRFLCLVCPTGNVDAVEMGNASTNAFSSWAGATNHTVKVRPGGLVLFVGPDATGYAAGNGEIKLLNTGTNDTDYELYVGGNE